MKGQLPRYWPAQQAYHHAREDLYRRIIADCRLSPAALILDAACGDAFYSDLLASAGLLSPGGRLIVVENDPFHCSIPAWSAEFERRVQHAVDRLLRQRCGNGTSIDRYSAPRHSPVWLARAGLRQITVRTYPVEDSAPLADDVERFWRLWMQQRGEMIRPFLSCAEWRAYARAFDPDGPEYVLNRPGVSFRDPTTVVCGVAE